MLKNFLVAILLCFFFLSSYSQTEFQKSGYNDLRIENEMKFAVPEKISNSLWEFLTQKYSNSGLFLKEYDSTFVIKTDEDLFIDQYFDNENWQLIEEKNGIRHRTRYVLTNSQSKKNGRQIIQIKINSIDSNKLDRAEFKYPAKKDKKHKLDSIIKIKPVCVIDYIKKKHKTKFTERLKEYNIDVSKIFSTIKLEQKRKRIYLYQDTLPFSTITLDYVTCSYKDKKADFIELELELNEIAYTESDPQKKAFMEKINEIVKSDITSKFPEIIQDQTPKYNKAFTYLELSSTNSFFTFIIVGIIAFAIFTVILVFNFLRKKRTVH